MKIAYYPGCTLKHTAQNLEQPALAALKTLGVEVEELPRWNCCGAVASLSQDDLLRQVAPVRNLIRALERGADKLLTLCAPCYNTLARANQLVREDAEKRKTLNTFMEEEPDYQGEVKVVHLLDYLRDEVGFDKLGQKVVKPLTGMKIAPYYGCTLLRPKAVAIEERPTLLHRFIEAIGATPVDFPAMTECCGSYQILGNEKAALEASASILSAASARGADAIVSSCPLCDYNLGARQADIKALRPSLEDTPTYYFTQLMALALGLPAATCRFDLSPPVCRALLEQQSFVKQASQ
ncbi:MAG: CoB--CoM heterodisulfide reductase iron-sulfur subunit B family protein [Pseudomonadota bacterium]